MIPVARWKGLGGHIDFNHRCFETYTLNFRKAFTAPTRSEFFSGLTDEICRHAGYSSTAASNARMCGQSYGGKRSRTRERPFIDGRGFRITRVSRRPKIPVETTRSKYGPYPMR